MKLNEEMFVELLEVYISMRQRPGNEAGKSPFHRMLWTFRPDYLYKLVSYSSALGHISPGPPPCLFSIPFIEVRDQKQPWRLWTLDEEGNET